jgi:cytoskeletal protein RodZ
MFRSKGKEPEQHDPAEVLVREAGARLREAREARGEQIEDVAENLRIRASYLRGLERGDLSVMPGRTYALGFLRSYAQYLGFDGEDLIAQIKSSVAGLTSGAHLQVRTPLAESRLPKLPALAISLAALAGIYAGWAYVEDRSATEVELVVEIPDELRQQPAPDITPAIASVPDPVPETDDAGSRLGSEAEPTVEVPPESQADPQPGTAERSVAEGPAAESATPEPGDFLTSSAPSATPLPRAGADQVAAPEPATGRPTVAEPDESEGADLVAALIPDGAATVPRVYRTDDARSRVLLRARTSAWVHVSSPNNDYLWVRTLQPGEAFAVPDRPDLVLWTGNAGGVEVVVDGEPLPPLGPEARVVRDVALRPDALLRRLLPEPAADAAAEPAAGSR